VRLSHSSSIGPRVRQYEKDAPDPAVSRLQHDPPSDRLSIDQPRFELDSHGSIVVGNRLVPSALVPSITDRDFASDV